MKYCKERGIHLNGPKLGKPYSDPAIQKQQKKLEWQESGERGEIERNFGVGKRRYCLDCIVTKLKETSEVMIHATAKVHEYEASLLQKLDEVAVKFYPVDAWNKIKQGMKSSVDMLLAEANS